MNEEINETITDEKNKAIKMDEKLSKAIYEIITETTKAI
jgi:hypothetical protein